MGDDQRREDGVIRWMDLQRAQAELRGEWRAELAAVETRQDAQMRETKRDIELNATRLDLLEATRDEQRGAWAMTRFLLGANLLGTALLLAGFVIAMRGGG